MSGVGQGSSVRCWQIKGFLFNDCLSSAQTFPSPEALSTLSLPMEKQEGWQADFAQPT